MRKKEKFEKINEKTECDEYALSSTFDLLISNAREHQDSSRRMKLESHVPFQAVSLRTTSDFAIRKKDKAYQEHPKQYERPRKYISRKKILRFDYISLEIPLPQLTTWSIPTSSPIQLASIEAILGSATYNSRPTCSPSSTHHGPSQTILEDPLHAHTLANFCASSTVSRELA